DVTQQPVPLLGAGGNLLERSLDAPARSEEIFSRNRITKNLTQFSEVFRVCDLMVVDLPNDRVLDRWGEESFVQVLNLARPGNRRVGIRDPLELFGQLVDLHELI